MKKVINVNTNNYYSQTLYEYMYLGFIFHFFAIRQAIAIGQ